MTDRREKQREYQKRYRDKHRAEFRARDRAAKAALPIEQKRAYNAKWRETVTEEWREAKRAYNRERLARIVAADPDYYVKRRMARLDYYRAKEREQYQRHRERHIATVKSSAERRRVRLAGGKTFRVTDLDWRRLIQRYEGCCAYCGTRPVQLHKDHVVPVVRGGTHSIGNILPACPSCNRSKGKRVIVEWRARQRMGLAA